MNASMLTTIIIDDESAARNVLKEMIEASGLPVTILAMAEDVPSGVKAINKFKPDFIFLDVEMPQYNGFQLLDFFETIDFDIVFATAYSEYAVRAFQVSAVDYLVKPIQLDYLITAIERVQQNKNEPKERYEVLKNNNTASEIQRLALPVTNGLLFTNIDDIIYIEAEGSYSYFHFTDGKKILVSKKIKEFENLLLPTGIFFRTHRSYIINLNKIKQYVKSDGGYIVMNNGQSVSISRELKDDFLSKIQN
ncbi:MAG: LytR/AlgR family response regulator transcription factor [Ferruginibacter sp.]